MPGDEFSTLLAEWKDPLDKYGANIPLEVLEAAIEAAPPEIQWSTDYNFFFGLLCGRQIELGVL